jgi:hypothetical protein
MELKLFPPTQFTALCGLLDMHLRKRTLIGFDMWRYYARSSNKSRSSDSVLDNCHFAKALPTSNYPLRPKHMYSPDWLEIETKKHQEKARRAPRSKQI